MQDAENSKRPDSAKDQEIRMLTSRNKDLVARLEDSEEHKSKAIMRLATVLSQYTAVLHAKATMSGAGGKGEFRATAAA